MEPELPRAIENSNAELPFAEIELPLESWADIFFCVLFAPVKTFLALGDPSIYNSDRVAKLSALLSVWVSVTFDAFANASVNWEEIDPFKIVSATFCGFTLWLAFASLLKFLSSWKVAPTNFGTCLIVTGWAFLPLILKVPAACLTNACPLFGLLMFTSSLWFLLLEVLAFDSVLHLGRSKTVALMICIPAVFLIVYAFWLGYFALSLVAFTTRSF